MYVSSVGPVDPATGQVRSTDITEQTRQCLRNLRAKLEAAGSSLQDVVWANWSLRETSDFDEFNEEWIRWFPGDGPIGQGTLLPLSHRRAGFRISIGVIAAGSGAPAVRTHEAARGMSSTPPRAPLERPNRHRRRRRPIVAIPVERPSEVAAAVPAPAPAPPPRDPSVITIVEGGALPLGDIDPDLYARHFPDPGPHG